MYRAIKNFAVQSVTTQKLVWYNIGDEVPKESIARLSPHALDWVVQLEKPKRKPNGKSKELPQRKSRKQSR